MPATSLLVTLCEIEDSSVEPVAASVGLEPAVGDRELAKQRELILFRGATQANYSPIVGAPSAAADGTQS
jgi:hypothetical protein